MTVPVPCTWDGEAFVPRQRFSKLCDKEFVIGQDYPLVVEEGRSQASHGHYFAALTEAWRNLPEDIAGDYPTPEHLRKKALIRCGFADERSIVCASRAEALRVAAFIKPMDDYAVVVVSEATIKVFTAKSQSKRAMGAHLFQESKQSVLDCVASLIGVTADSLQVNAKAAA